MHNRSCVLCTLPNLFVSTSHIFSTPVFRFSPQCNRVGCSSATQHCINDQLVPDILRQCSGLESSDINCPAMWHNIPVENIPHLFDDLTDNIIQETYVLHDRFSSKSYVFMTITKCNNF